MGVNPPFLVLDMSNFQNLRNRRYYISGHQVSRSVSKSSGTIGSTRKNDTYIVYMYTCEMHKHDVAYCHALQTLIFWPLCFSEDCRKNEKKSSQTKRERRKWYQSAAPGSHFTSYAWKLSTSRYYIKVDIPTFPYPWGLQNDTRNDIKTIPISDPFCVSKTMTHVYGVQHRVFFWCSPQVPRKSTPLSKLFSL